MYNMDIDTRTTAPVIPSQLSALTRVANWVKENDFSIIKDGDGSCWEVEIQASEIPDPNNQYGLLWDLSLDLKLDITGEELLKIGALELGRDDRLLEMLGKDRIPLAIRPKTFQGPSDEEVRKRIVEALPKVRSDLEAAKLIDIKRTLAGRWIDEGRVFGSEFK